MGLWDDLLAKKPFKGQGKMRLPSLDVRDVKIPTHFLSNYPGQKGQIPNASLVYGIGASIFVVLGFYSFFTGAWFTALLLLGVAGILFAFAQHFLKPPR